MWDKIKMLSPSTSYHELSAFYLGLAVSGIFVGLQWAIMMLLGSVIYAVLANSKEAKQRNGKRNEK